MNNTAPNEPPKTLAKIEPRSQVVKWILAGHSEDDIAESITVNFPEADPEELFSAAIQSLKMSSRIDPDLVRGFVFEALRDIYRRALDSNENAVATRALSLILEMADEVRDTRIEQLEDEIKRLQAEIGSAEQLLFGGEETVC